MAVVMHRVNGKVMTASGSDPDDKVIVDPAGLEPGGHGCSAGRPDEPRAGLARGTRDHLPCPQPAAEGHSSRSGPHAPERDPVAVLRAWPHSTGPHGDVPPRARTATPPPPTQRRIDDKIVLAHLALDLYREIDQIQGAVHRAPSTASSAPAPEPCSDPRCTMQAHVLRGALVEACLLVQRVAMSTPDDRLDIEDRIYELLELLRH